MARDYGHIAYRLDTQYSTVTDKFSSNSEGTCNKNNIWLSKNATEKWWPITQEIIGKSINFDAGRIESSPEAYTTYFYTPSISNITPETGSNIYLAATWGKLNKVHLDNYGNITGPFDLNNSWRPTKIRAFWSENIKLNIRVCCSNGDLIDNTIQRSSGEEIDIPLTAYLPDWYNAINYIDISSPDGHTFTIQNVELYGDDPSIYYEVDSVLTPYNVYKFRHDNYFENGLFISTAIEGSFNPFNHTAHQYYIDMIPTGYSWSRFHYADNEEWIFTPSDLVNYRAIKYTPATVIIIDENAYPGEPVTYEYV